MSLVQLPECGGFSLGWADALRKAIAKKNPAAYDQLTVEYFDNMRKKGLSENLCNYVWNVLVATSRGYGFNASHTLAYSLVALQEMNLAWKYPVIFWNCACLITDSGGMEEDEEPNEEIVDIYESEDFEEYEYIDSPDKQTKVKKKRVKSNNYEKIASAIGKMRSAGVEIMLPDINDSLYTFVPDVENNRILFGLRGIINVGEDVIAAAIANRPYNSIVEFYEKVKPNKRAMISLIQCGAFDALEDRKFAMTWFIWETCDKKKNLNLQNLSTLEQNGLIPKDTEQFAMAWRVYEFNRYLKQICKSNGKEYLLDERAIDFLNELGINCGQSIGIKSWDKVYQTWMDIYRNWIKSNPHLLQSLNDIVFKKDWDKYAEGSLSKWEMNSLGFYYHEHELENINTSKYGISDFSRLSEVPEIETTITRKGKEIPIYSLKKICGTCIAKNKAKGTVTLLTTSGVVNVKIRKEVFAVYDKQISEVNDKGTKTVKEHSWFNRGAMIMVLGIRSGDDFISKRYSSSSMTHQVYRIDDILSDGDLVFQIDRYGGGEE